MLTSFFLHGFVAAAAIRGSRRWQGAASVLLSLLMPIVTAHTVHAQEPISAATEAAAGTDKASNTAIIEHGSTCGDCSVCHGPLAGLSVPAWTAPQQAGALPQALGWNALSASPLPQLKPPRA